MLDMMGSLKVEGQMSNHTQDLHDAAEANLKKDLHSSCLPTLRRMVEANLRGVVGMWQGNQSVHLPAVDQDQNLALTGERSIEDISCDHLRSWRRVRA